MKCNANFSLDFGDLNQIYFKLLKEEDFNFKTKDIFLNLKKNETNINVEISSNNILELKVGVSAFIKSLEIIDKTLKI